VQNLEEQRQEKEKEETLQFLSDSWLFGACMGDEKSNEFTLFTRLSQECCNGSIYEMYRIGSGNEIVQIESRCGSHVCLGFLRNDNGQKIENVRFFYDPTEYSCCSGRIKRKKGLNINCVD
jgi:hypothetical protein